MRKVLMVTLVLLVISPWFLWKGPCWAGDIVPPYQNLGQFVAKDGTLDQRACYEEMERQRITCYQKIADQVPWDELKMGLKNCTACSGIFHAIKEQILEPPAK